MKILKEGILFLNIEDFSGDIAIIVNGTDLIDMDREEAKVILEKAGMIEDNGDIVIPVNSKLIKEENYCGATEYTLIVNGNEVIVDLTDVMDLFIEIDNIIEEKINQIHQHTLNLIKANENDLDTQINAMKNYTEQSANVIKFYRNL